MIFFKSFFLPNASLQNLRLVNHTMCFLNLPCLICDNLQCQILKFVRNKAKGESQNGVSRKQSTPDFPKNEYFLPPGTHMYVCVSGSKKCSFFGKFGVLCFLETPVLRFALLPYYRQVVKVCWLNTSITLSSRRRSVKDNGIHSIFILFIPVYHSN